MILVAFMVEGNCVLDFCLDVDSYDSGYSKTNEVLSVPIDGGHGCLDHKRPFPANPSR